MLAKRSLYNLIFGLTSQGITIVLGLIIPRLFIVHYGSESYGLISSIGQIVIYMSLLEAGVGAASLQALYKQVSNQDKQSINEILSATSKFYKKTGRYYLICVIFLSLIYPLIVESSISKTTIIIIILFTGISGALNFYFQGTYTVLLIAEGKSYINSVIKTTINILGNLLRIILIIKGFDILVVQGSYFIITLFQILIYYFYIKKNYKWLNLNSNPNHKAISQKNSVLIHQVSGLIFRNTDVLILTIFTNLKVVSVYVLYNLFFSVIDNICNTVNNSITFVLGRKFHESKNKFMNLYDAYETYFMALVFTLFSVSYILILPFMEIYTSGVTDINYINEWLPILFIIIKLLSNARASSTSLIEIAGHFKKTQYRSILESVINLSSSIICVIYFGIYGVLIGTIIALLYRSIDMIIYSNRKILLRGPWTSIKRWLINVCIFMVIAFISTICIKITPTTYLGVISWAIFLTFIYMVLFITINSLFERKVYLYSIDVVRGFLNKKAIK